MTRRAPQQFSDEEVALRVLCAMVQSGQYSDHTALVEKSFKIADLFHIISHRRNKRFGDEEE